MGESTASTMSDQLAPSQRSPAAQGQQEVLPVRGWRKLEQSGSAPAEETDQMMRIIGPAQVVASLVTGTSLTTRWASS